MRFRLIAWVLLLPVVGGCTNRPAMVGGAYLAADGDLGAGLRVAYERGLSLGAEDIYAPMEFSVAAVLTENGDEWVGWVGASVVWQYLWGHDFGPPRPGHWHVELDLLTGAGMAFFADEDTSAWSLGARLRFTNTDRLCLDVAYRWVPVDIVVSGSEVSDLGGLEISVGREW